MGELTGRTVIAYISATSTPILPPRSTCSTDHRTSTPLPSASIMLLAYEDNLPAIGTLVERTTGYTILVHLPGRYKAEQVRAALTDKIKTIPEILRASFTWDQGIEMRDWQQVSVAANIDVYFCDPHSPWQRGPSENTKGLLRQYRAHQWDRGGCWSSTTLAAASIKLG